MRVFITGIKGFIPSHLANYLSSLGHEVYGIDNNMHASKNKLEVPIRYFYGDVRYPSDVDAHIKEADIVYHMAAQINVDKSIAFPHETMDINLMGTLNVLESCKRYNKTLVFASTSEVYGGHTENIHEGSPTYAQSPYAVSKLAADKLCGNYHDLYNLKVFRVRCFNTFGPFQAEDQYGAVIPKFTKSYLNNEQPVIFGDGNQERDFIHVDDVVRAYAFIPKVDDLAGEPVNVGTGKSVKINKIADLIGKTLHSKIKPIHVNARKGEVCRLRANIKLLKRSGFSPSVRFEDGLKEYVLWLKEQSLLQI